MNKKRLWKVLAVIGILCWVGGGNYGGDVIVNGGLAFLGLVLLISAWAVWNISRKS